MKISVIIPAWNEEELLPETLPLVKECMTAFSEKGWDTELIVTDNNSTDRTAEIAKEYGAKVVFEPVNQIARARNAGAKEATGDWFLFVDADSWPTKELFADIEDAMSNRSIVGGGSKVKFDLGWKHLDVAFWTGVWNLLSRTFKWAAGSLVYAEAEAFRAIGGFDEQFYASEEIHTSRKLRKEGKNTKRKFIILTKHPLVSSGRKLVTVGRWGLFKYVVKVFLSGGGMLKKRESCDPWYGDEHRGENRDESDQ
jgi:glycosyltransferase involved in cell wall biosynthesis